MIRVASAMPTSGLIDYRCTQSAMLVSNQAGLNGIELIPGTISRVTVETARNWLASGFLSMKDVDWCFWMDSDMTWPADTLVTLMRYAQKLNAKFLSGIYYQRTCTTEHGGECKEGNHKPVLWRRDEVIEGADGKMIVRRYEDAFVHHTIVPTSKNPFVAHAVGFGCVLIHREIIEKMKKPYFKFVDLGEDKQTGEWRQASEDFWFCVNARKLGYDLWIIPEISCGHIGEAPVITEKHFRIKRDDVYQIKMEGAKPTGSAA